MNNIPQIIVNSGFPVDQNGALTEIVFPKVVATLNAPTKITFLGETLNYVPSTTAALQEIEAPNVTVFSSNTFQNYNNLVTAKLDNVVTMTVGPSSSTGLFYDCRSLRTVYAPNLEECVTSGYAAGYCGAFAGCTSLVTLDLPSFRQTTDATTTAGAFRVCTGLQNVTLGSVGHAVTGLASNTFSGDTQTGLTITIYTTGGAALSGSPWGATNATIEYEEA